MSVKYRCRTCGFLGISGVGVDSANRAQHLCPDGTDAVWDEVEQMMSLFVEPRPKSGAPVISASTPKLNRRFSEKSTESSLNFFSASPLVAACYDRPRSASIQPQTNHKALFDTSQPFALNNLSQSLYNDSGINECSFGLPSTKSVRSLNKELLNETPPGTLYDNEGLGVEVLPPSDDENEDPETRNKRGLSDSYLALKEKSPSVQQMKRPSGDSLPSVPNCFDTSYGKLPQIGDQTREFLLPYNKCNSEHCDFMCISPDTMADLLRGKYEKKVMDVVIIDARYPYEYKGGHIKGACTVVTKEDMLKRYLDKPDTPRYQVVIFHCEFSSKRGPSMCRYVRHQDRLLNTHRYPRLFYPEMYILHGGYKDFYNLYPELCVPQNYIPMLDPAFADELPYWQKTAKFSVSNGHTKPNEASKRTLITRTKSSRQLLLEPATAMEPGCCSPLTG